MSNTWQAAIHTPWWVYLLFVYLIFIGVRASRTNIISLFRVFIIPIIFTAMSIDTLVSAVKINTFSITTWVIAIVLGMTLGFIQIFRLKLVVDRKHSLIQIPGTWSTMIFILIIFIAKYYFGYELAMDPEAATNTTFEFWMLGISGLFTGMFLGRLECYLYRYFTNESVDLTTMPK